MGATSARAQRGERPGTEPGPGKRGEANRDRPERGKGERTGTTRPQNKYEKRGKTLGEFTGTTGASARVVGFFYI